MEVTVGMMQRSMNGKAGKREISVVMALVAGLALRLYFVAHAARIDGDSLIYGSIAKNWLEHGVYGYASTPHGPLPTLIRLPGYPIFLVICFALFGVDHYAAAMYLQCFVDLGTCVLVGALARRLFGERAGLAALWLAVLCPFTASYVGGALTETLTLFTIAVTFYALERWRSAGCSETWWLWVMGVAMSYSLLLRPEQGLLAAAVVPVVLWCGGRETGWRRGVGRAALVSALVLLPLAPWAVRNWRTFHVVEPLAPRFATDPGEAVPLGFQRWYRTWGVDFKSTQEVYWNYDSAEIELRDLPKRAFDSREQYEETAALLKGYNRNFNATPQLDAGFERIAEERISARPVRYYVELPVARLLNMLFRPRVEMFSTPLDWWNYREHGHKTVFALAYAGLNIVYLVLGGVGLWMWRRDGWGGVGWSMVGFVVLRCALLLTLDNSEPRYTLELFPVVMVWAGRLWGVRRFE